MSSCLSEIDDEVLEEAAADLYYELNDRVFGDTAGFMPFSKTPIGTRELYHQLALTVIETLRRNYE